MKALDLFCGGGGVTKGLQRAGFHVTGVDINPQPRYCGNIFYQQDAIAFAFSSMNEWRGGTADHHPELCDGCGLHFDLHFDFVWASPPCQAYSAMKTMHNAKKDHPELVEPTRRRLIKAGAEYCIENVPGAPLLPGSVMLCGTMFGLGVSEVGAELRRHRWFETSFHFLAPPCQHAAPIVCGVYGGHGRDRRRLHPLTVGVYGNGPRRSRRDGIQQFSTEQRKEAMGIDWMDGTTLSQAIPPAYSQFIAERMLEGTKYEMGIRPTHRTLSLV